MVQSQLELQSGEEGGGKEAEQGKGTDDKCLAHPRSLVGTRPERPGGQAKEHHHAELTGGKDFGCG